MAEGPSPVSGSQLHKIVGADVVDQDENQAQINICVIFSISKFGESTQIRTQEETEI
jgi:hypothetical protein